MVAAATQLSIFSPDTPAEDKALASAGYAALQRQLLIDRVIDLLVQKAMLRIHWPEVYAQAERLLQSFPLPAAQRRTAFRRMQNAKSYAVAGEFGAAAYELRMLRTQLA